AADRQVHPPHDHQGGLRHAEDRVTSRELPDAVEVEAAYEGAVYHPEHGPGRRDQHDQANGRALVSDQGHSAHAVRPESGEPSHTRPLPRGTLITGGDLDYGRGPRLLAGSSTTGRTGTWKSPRGPGP